MKLICVALASSLLISACVQTGKNMHTERALTECREDIGVDRRACENAVRDERRMRDIQERVKAEKDLEEAEKQ